MANGITPLVSPNFTPDSINVAPLRETYLKLHHTIDKLLYKLYRDGAMIFLRKQEAMGIEGLHLSPQHHADSKGKPEGRIIGDWKTGRSVWLDCVVGSLTVSSS